MNSLLYHYFSNSIIFCKGFNEMALQVVLGAFKFCDIEFAGFIISQRICVELSSEDSMIESLILDMSLYYPKFLQCFIIVVCGQRWGIIKIWRRFLEVVSFTIRRQVKSEKS